MNEFFKVTDLFQVLEYVSEFSPVGIEHVSLDAATGRVLAGNIFSDSDLPDFSRSTVDGYALCASATFGATESIPAYFNIIGTIAMGEHPAFSIGPGDAARISTGGMLPEGADSAVMIEHTEKIGATAIEVYRSVAPGQNIVEKGEDFKKNEIILSRGRKLRSQETGLLAAFGKATIPVFKKPVVGIISTGDEIIPVDKIPGPGQIRDINSYTLSGLVEETGGIPVIFGIIQDDADALFEICSVALAQSDMVLISGGSSIGARDFTIDVLSSLPDTSILVHGISISPGKPTILAKTKGKPFWGLPGHVASAMVVFQMVVRPFVEYISGLALQHKKHLQIPAFISRNIVSAQGRTDYIRVRLIEKGGDLWAEPLLGKSGLLNTMVNADGLIEIGVNTEGLDKGATVWVIPLSTHFNADK